MRLFLVAVIIATLCAIKTRSSFVKACSTRVSFGPTYVSARRSEQQGLAIPLPRHWSWQTITHREVDMYHDAFHKRLKVGIYASPVINQHRSQWCGCCYMIAVLQMLQDRTHVLMGNSSTVQSVENKMLPWVEFDSQVALDTYDTLQRPVSFQPWNACRGGDPIKVLRAIEEEIVPLLIVPGDGASWLGYPNVDRNKSREKKKKKARSYSP